MLDKTFRPAEVEARIHGEWQTADAFSITRQTRGGGRNQPYCIVIPPPNVTGSLHMGHALNNTLQDILIRYERMRGRDVLWQPGTDHAGIATQMVVERKLAADKQPPRRELGREEFLRRVWSWKEESGGTIVNQLKRLGASCDWGRERFTMDEGLSKAVLKVFVELHRAGLIYKDKRLVNWDPKFQTAISDLEVIQVDKKGSFKWTSGDPEKPFDAAALGKVLARDPSGHMYHFRYPLKGKSFKPDDPSTFIVVATTRPETMLGDTAVAVHPDDERYKALVGRHVVLPLVGREIPIVADEYSDSEKGSGAVKITPAHDFNDFEVGKRHNLQQIKIFDEFGRIIRSPFSDFTFSPGLPVAGYPNLTAPMEDGVAGPPTVESIPEHLRGLDRFDARKRIVSDLEAIGCLARIEPTAHTVPHGDRSNVPIEPYLTDQWYVDAATLAKPALEAVRAGKTRFVPERFANDYYRWLENIQPWCVSRQLWWGHQIPAWYGPDGTVFVAMDEAEARMMAERHYASAPSPFERSEKGRGRGEGQGPAAARGAAPHPGPLPPSGGRGGISLTRDPDVLDTWFSSALWPFSTLGWPDETPELARYYPTATLVTGFDIIFFWVARMMMMGLHFMKEVPFRDVVIHGLVRDASGQKMSKSKGNVLDPLELIDEFGADALRFCLAAQAAQGADVKFSKQRVEGYRNFATKLWNAARFAEMNECVAVADFDPAAAKEPFNRWIAGETEKVAKTVGAAIEGYRYNEAAGALYEFVWGVFCDWYLELVKPALTGEEGAAKTETRAMVAWVRDEILKLLHPLMPFLTEELWARTAEHGPAREGLLCQAAWPEHSGLVDTRIEAEVGGIVRLISEVRSVRSEMNVPASLKVPLVIVGASAAVRARITGEEDTVKRLARLSEIRFETATPKGAALIVAGDTTAALPLDGVIDMAAETKRLAKLIADDEGDQAKMDAKLSNPSFMERAKPEAIEEAQERKAELLARIKRHAAQLKRLEA